MNKYLSAESFVKNEPPISTELPPGLKQKFKIDKSKKYKITNVQFPKLIAASAKYKSKYSTLIEFQDEQGRKHDKTVLFGDKNRSDYIDHKVERIRDDFLKNIKMREDLANPEFDPKFWEIFLLNNKETDFYIAFQLLRSKILS